MKEVASLTRLSPFENDHDFAGHLQTLRHRQRGHGVRWRNERTKDKTNGQRQSRQGMKQEGRRAHRQEDQDGGQRKNRPQVGAEISPGSEDRRGIKQGRKKQIKDQFRLEMNHRQAGHQREAATSDGQQDGIRDADLPGDDRQQCDRDETNQN